MPKTSTRKNKRFSIGNLYFTDDVSSWLEENYGFYEHLQRNARVIGALHRHTTCDWGDLDAEDKKANDDAMKSGGRLFSAYYVEGRKIWIITEADRSATTILFPEEY